MSLESFIKSKNSQVRITLFSDFGARFPELALLLVPAMLKVKDLNNWFTITAVLSLLPALAKKSQAGFRKYESELTEAYRIILLKAHAVPLIPTDRLKQLMKDLNSVVRISKIKVGDLVLGLNDVEALRDVKSLAGLVSNFERSFRE